MDDVTKVLLGTIAGFFAALFGEHVKRVHASRAAAMMIVRELAFHKQRLSLALALDRHPDATYMLIFPSTIWDTQATALISGAPVRKAEPILDGYASTKILTHGRPDRNRLPAALEEAYAAAVALSRRWSIRKKTTTVLPLFEDILGNERKTS